MADDRIALSGSDRQTLPNAQSTGPADPDQQIEVTVMVKPHTADSRTALAEMAGQSPPERQYLTREEFAQAHGAAQADLDQVAVWAESQALSVVETSIARRSVVLSGTVAAFAAAFGVTLTTQQVGGHTFRGRTGPVYLPAGLAPIVQGVFGLDDRPQATSHVRVRPAAGTDISYTPPQVAQAYDFPADTDGMGETIGLIELGGGYRVKDLKAYFAGLGIPQPKVTAARVDGGSNKPTGDPNSADVEVMLDIEVAGGVAPGAHIVVYFTPNTDQGFLNAVTTAIHDTTHKPSVISISWGGPESAWTAQSLQAFDQAFADAATMGITICCASGDSGSSDGATDGLAHVDFPASSPHALSCGGTSLRATQSTITGETVWNDGADGGAGGGGISDVFAVPDYQAGAHVPASANSDRRIGRGVPDVAGVADPVTGYQIEVDGQQTVGGGTSAVAPLWAGLIARLNQALGKPVGFLNTLLYTTAVAEGAFHDITTGDNGAYQAGPGWDACTGLGSPDGEKLLSALKES